MTHNHDHLSFRNEDADPRSQRGPRGRRGPRFDGPGFDPGMGREAYGDPRSRSFDGHPGFPGDGNGPFRGPEGPGPRGSRHGGHRGPRGGRAARGDVRTTILRLLSEENLPLDADLAMADDGQLVAMADLHEALKRVLSPADVRNPNPWVTASKLCARKRPDLFPVRDNVVVKYLGLDRPKGNYQVDWQVFRHVIQDNAIRRRLDAIVDEASRSPGVDVGHPNWRLRHLDVVLWMHARPQDARTSDAGDVGIPLG